MATMVEFIKQLAAWILDDPSPDVRVDEPSHWITAGPSENGFLPLGTVSTFCYAQVHTHRRVDRSEAV